MIRSLNMRRQPCIHFFDIIMRRESVSPPKFLLDFLQDFDYSPSDQSYMRFNVRGINLKMCNLKQFKSTNFRVINTNDSPRKIDINIT